MASPRSLGREGGHFRGTGPRPGKLGRALHPGRLGTPPAPSPARSRLPARTPGDCSPFLGTGSDLIGTSAGWLLPAPCSPPRPTLQPSPWASPEPPLHGELRTWRHLDPSAASRCRAPAQPSPVPAATPSPCSLRVSGGSRVTPAPRAEAPVPASWKARREKPDLGEWWPRFFLFLLLNLHAKGTNCWEAGKLKGKRKKTKAGGPTTHHNQIGLGPVLAPWLLCTPPVPQPPTDPGPDTHRLQRVFAGWRQALGAFLLVFLTQPLIKQKLPLMVGFISTRIPPPRAEGFEHRQLKMWCISHHGLLCSTSQAEVRAVGVSMPRRQRDKSK